MKILNIAEKPSVAKSISAVLSTNSRVTHGKHKYCPNIFFKWENEMIFTSVLGHLFSWDFKMKTGWTESDPYGLFEAEIEKRLSEDMNKVAENIKTLSRQCEMVVIWTDCDREGENIASQIREIVGNKKVRRARFSAISRSEVERAIRNLTEINDRESVAVEARIELDLRIGSAFTRFQTLAYSSACMFSKRLILSFGPCQIPTLNFVVQRHNQIIKFKPEKFYSLENKVIKMSIDKGYDNGYDKTIGKTINKSINKTIDKTIDRNTINDNKNRPFTCFKWKRGNIFSKNCILLFYSLLKNGRAIITNKAVQNREKFRPLPLRTVEFQKICSSYFKIPGHLLMEVAEKLYNNGYISYPRTETDSFIKGFNFNEIVNKLKNDEAVGSYASDFTFKYPRSGNSNDQAHSPIYPLKSGNGLKGDERRVYEFIARRFLGCISENAKGIETEYTMEIGYDNNINDDTVYDSKTIDNIIDKTNNNMNIDNIIDKTNNIYKEEFTCKGLIITERNYLNIYTYDKWEAVYVDDFSINERIENNIEMTEGITTAPEYLTESDLIGLMDKNGIGTDATIHEHIQKIQTREYALKKNYRFIPTLLGINLIKVYIELDLGINEPEIRKNLEERLKLVCIGEIKKEELIEEEVRLYKRIYKRLEDGSDLFKQLIKSGVDESNNGDGKGYGDKGNKGYGNNSYGNDNKSYGNDNKGYDNDNKSYGKVKNKNDNKQENRNNMNSNRININCKCNETAKKCISKKGKTFYGCHSLPRLCDFFKWENEVDESPTERNARTTTKPSKRERENEVVKCDCGYETVVKKARTESNNGRLFHCCNKNYKKCKFFKWVE